MLQVCNRLAEEVIQVEAHAVPGPAAFRGDREHRRQDVLHLTGDTKVEGGGMGSSEARQAEHGDI